MLASIERRVCKAAIAAVLVKMLVIGIMPHGVLRDIPEYQEVTGSEVVHHACWPTFAL
ncbi:hypothetical protein D3C87_2003760 [compost metagenome]